MVFAMQSIHRGEHALSMSDAEARPDADGAITFDRGAMRESLRDGDDGLEQSWQFDARPPGDGDLTLALDVRGATHVATTW